MLHYLQLSYSNFSLRNLLGVHHVYWAGLGAETGVGELCDRDDRHSISERWRSMWYSGCYRQQHSAVLSIRHHCTASGAFTSTFHQPHLPASVHPST